MLRTPKPTHARFKRELKKREPKIEESNKKALFLRGSSTNSIIRNALIDLYALKKPDAIYFSKKNSIYPFEDTTSLKFLSEKNDTSLIVIGMHTKKRPHTLIFARMFDYDVLDMIELSIQNPVSMFEFKNEKNGIGLRPMLLFIGPLFESSPKYRLCKSIFFDFFRGQPFNKLNVEGLQHAICFSVQEPTDDVPYPPIYFRVYMVKYQKINQINPKIDLEEMGPRYDFVIQRTYEADDKLMKEAMKKPKKQTPVIKKNIDVNKIGDKVGQIYLMKQNMDNLQTRKFRGLKRKTTEKNEDISYNKNSKKHCPTTSERNESTS